ncbi:MAG: hypothetical protein M1818_002017 [Claussenomyces sp. TS43310]|nr:MAG: hypothetical protein M1818_002017 [Claussenomyces sp. TS43310]
MEQTKALHALEPFLALTKSASSPLAAIDLINRATSAPNTYIFTELLLTPQIQSLATASASGGEYPPASYLRLLEIFSYGTYHTYTSTSSLPPLTEAQTLKLRQLSLLTLARDPTQLNYANLIQVLELSSARELENLVISAIYAGLLVGTLDPNNQLVCISSVMPLRDVAPSSVPTMISALREWSDRCTSTLSSLEKQIANIKADAAMRQKSDRDWDQRVKFMVETVNDIPGKDERTGRRVGNRKGGGGEAVKRGWQLEDLDNGEMDVDDDADGDLVERGNARLKKRGTGGVR